MMTKWNIAYIVLYIVLQHKAANCPCKAASLPGPTAGSCPKDSTVYFTCFYMHLDSVAEYDKQNNAVGYLICMHYNNIDSTVIDQCCTYRHQSFAV